MFIKKRLTIIITNSLIILYIILCFSSCKNTNNTGGQIMTSDKYYFEMTSERKLEFINKMKNISPGDSISKILNILGKADYDEIGYKKGPLNENKSDGFICRSLTYYLKRWEKDMVNEKKDKNIIFIFDKNNILKKIISNVDSMPNIM